MEIIDTYLFWSHVDRKSEDECWNWTASKDRDGYGKFHIERNKNKYALDVASRVAYKATHGSIPDKMCVLHTCDNPSCCNPKHLFLGTKKDNTQDMILKGRKIDFKGEDHPNSVLTEDNIKEIFSLYRDGYTQTEIADQFHVTQVCISSILSRKIWKHVLV